MSFQLRETVKADLPAIKLLYKAVAANPRGIARSEAEITDAYVNYLWEGIQADGLGMVVFDGERLIGEIHASKKGLGIFDHILSHLTIGVHPDYQGKGLGKMLFQHFLASVVKERPEIYRVELEARASNVAGLKLYESQGFVLEGRMINQTKNLDGSHEDGVMYAWFNPAYSADL